jgi:hypothetical protein
MPWFLLRVRRPAVVRIAILTAVATLSIPGVASAAPTPMPLNPVPPDSYICQVTGAGTTCKSHTLEPYSAEGTGIICGSGATAVELLDNGTQDVDATRWYDRDGNLTRRIRTLLFRGSFLSDPATGKTIGYSQHNTDVDDLAVPGDFASSTFTGHGHLNITVPGAGAVIVDAGRQVFDPAGNLEFSAGPTDLDSYFNGLTSVVGQLCAYLGTP